MPTANATDQDVLSALEATLKKLKPILLTEGGDTRISSVEEGVARIELLGGCEGCGGGIATMAGGLRLMLLERVPGLKEVIFV